MRGHPRCTVFEVGREFRFGGEERPAQCEHVAEGNTAEGFVAAGALVMKVLDGEGNSCDK